MVITVVRKQPRIDHVTVFVVVFLTVVVIGDALCIALIVITTIILVV